ncbi:LysR substrate-binding domain-containing protein [Nocardioides bizhenqiangii]|uniref:LysR substrate-binding domain-containing protein n=1 Tax=Nocardioides bizhenqiangii TaxID=3095076 RepID=A0ABZ0ZLU3_9ACTN|nr:LysR substrate-binding domain-containing protein [Nocardioides sp. HM61]WQQ25318.1 LysR substrate-binding domain-containing protein [Nocardioides sp. HM61]
MLRLSRSRGARTDLEASSPDTLLGLVRRGVGVALLSASMTLGADGLSAMVVTDAPVQAKLGLAARRGRRPAASEELLGRLCAALIG